MNIILYQTEILPQKDSAVLRVSLNIFVHALHILLSSPETNQIG